MDSAPIELRKPVKDFGRDVSRVTIAREATGADLLAIDGLGAIKSTLVLIQRMCVDQDGKPMSQACVESMTARDIKAIETALVPFVADGPQT